MPNNMRTKYQGGGGFTYGAGDGDETPQKANMNMMAKGGGLMGFTAGGGVIDNLTEPKKATYGNMGSMSVKKKK